MTFTKKNTIKYAEQMLLQWCINGLEGPVKVGEFLDVTKKTIVSWRSRCYIPLTQVYKAAKIFKVRPEVLNRKQRTSLYHGYLPWDKAIDEIKWLTEKQKKLLIKLPKRFE